MRFSPVTFVAVLASVAIAGPVVAPEPAEAWTRDVAVTDQSDQSLVEEAIIFAVQPDASCNLISCAKVLAAAVCIAADIASDNPGGIIKCVSGGASKVSNYAVPSLSLFRDIIIQPHNNHINNIN